MLTTEEEQEFIATQEGSQTTDQDVTQESEEAPLSWETHGYMGRDYTQQEIGIGTVYPTHGIMVPNSHMRHKQTMTQIGQHGLRR